MKTRTLHFGLMLLSLFCAIAIPAQAQTANAQQTFNQYVADLQSNPNDTALRGKIIALAQTMRPAPAIPEEARGHYVMAQEFAEKAKNDTERAKDSSDLKLASAGFARAVAEYKAVLLAAPWWADAYKKLAMVQKAAEQYDDAIASLNLYLTASPADARDAQDEIYKLRADKQAAAEQKVADERKQQEEQQRQREEQQRAYAASPEGRLDALLRRIDGRAYVRFACFNSACESKYEDVATINGRTLRWDRYTPRYGGGYNSPSTQQFQITGFKSSTPWGNGSATEWIIDESGSSIEMRSVDSSGGVHSDYIFTPQ